MLGSKAAREFLVSHEAVLTTIDEGQEYDEEGGRSEAEKGGERTRELMVKESLRAWPAESE